MGWLFFEKPKNVKDYFVQQLDLVDTERGITRKVLDIAIVNMSTAYVAVQHTDAEKNEVFAAVILLKFTRERYYNFGYKDMTEHMGPCERSCPERILKLLTPLPDETEDEVSSITWAREWRRDCWARIEEAKKWKAWKKEGTRLKARDPAGVKFNGIEAPIQEAVVELVQGRRKKVWAVRVLPGYTYYRLNAYVMGAMEAA